MLESHLEYIESYNALNDAQKTRHREYLKSLINSLNTASGSYPVILGLLLAENREFTVLLSENTEPMNDTEFRTKLNSEYKKAVYEYQKRLTVICDLCLEDKAAQYRFCGNFTSFDNIECIAELVSVSFGVLRRLQKTADGRRPIAKLRSCAVKLKTSLEHMQEMISDVTDDVNGK